MSELTWRKEPPDKPGWWWCDPVSSSVECLEVFQDVGELYVNDPGAMMCMPVGADFYANCKWAGPIEPPKQ